MNIFLQAAAAVFTPSALFFMLVGTFFGILCGAMPGLSAVMAVSILRPVYVFLEGNGHYDAAGYLLRCNLRRLHYRDPYQHTGHGQLCCNLPGRIPHGTQTGTAWTGP